MLTPLEARQLAMKWRAQFPAADAYVTSVNRYLERFPAPARSYEGLDRWLREDAQQDQVRGELLLHGRVEENAPQHLPDLVDDCPTCRGKRWLRRDLAVGHAEFGKAIRCPECHGHTRPVAAAQAASSPPVDVTDRRCSKCGKREDEPAGERCGHPVWHLPNWRAPAVPAADIPRDYVAELARNLKQNSKLSEQKPDEKSQKKVG